MATSEEDPQKILRKKLNGYWRHTGYLVDTEQVNRIRKYLKEAEAFLDKGQVTDGFDAYYRAKREYRLARLNGKLYFRRDWRGMQFALISIGVFVVGLLVVWNYRQNAANVLLPLLSVFGGGIGGGSAVLIRAIDVDPESEVVSHWSWYVIKTVLGASFGLITYFALVAGLNLFSDSAEITKPEGAIVIGFLAGFFETFSTGVLARLAGQFTTDSGKEPQTSESDRDGLRSDQPGNR